ncbi:hypothetical protein Ancab_029405 [Ancistrocladus abbreviatus]
MYPTNPEVSQLGIAFVPFTLVPLSSGGFGPASKLPFGSKPKIDVQWLIQGKGITKPRQGSEKVLWSLLPKAVLGLSFGSLNKEESYLKAVNGSYKLRSVGFAKLLLPLGA